MIAKDTDRDNFMSAEKAHKYGIVDKILDYREANEKVVNIEYGQSVEFAKIDHLFNMAYN